MMTMITNPVSETAYLFPGTEHTREQHRYTDHRTLAAIRFVRKLGIRPNLSGYHLLISSILLAMKEPALLDSMTRALYPAVAKLHGCSVRTVESSIRKAIRSAYESDPERIRSVFYYKVSKPYISEVVSLAVESIRYEAAFEAQMYH